MQNILGTKQRLGLAEARTRQGKITPHAVARFIRTCASPTACAAVTQPQPDSTSRRRRLLPRLHRQEQGSGGRVSLRSPSPTGTRPPKPAVLPLSYNSVSSTPDSLGFGVGYSSMATTLPNLVRLHSSPSTKLWFVDGP